jgi:hypothetical protein
MFIKMTTVIGQKVFSSIKKKKKSRLVYTPIRFLLQVIMPQRPVYNADVMKQAIKDMNNGNLSISSS